MGKVLAARGLNATDIAAGRCSNREKIWAYRTSDMSVSDCLHSNDLCDVIRAFALLVPEEIMTSPDNSVELVRDKKWTVRITAYGSTLTFPFEAESYARSYADGQAFRLGVQVAELKRCG
ncbi:hypothetical protein [Mesorhizobium sp. LSJC264A00]|uniref:hypothetical protein n=1 Tax=unclassified Mesorhizobium TaxID=325217 RepID=UPI001FD9E07C|nr:hypothetical protein [Mesorhizobium sp. LSJC264A00]